MRTTVTPRSYSVENLTEYSAVTIMLNPGRLVTVNGPSIAYYPADGKGITVRSRHDATVKSSHPEARIIERYTRQAAPVTRTEPTLHENVARGVALLDRVRPGWAQEMNLDTFDLGDGANCVLGQLYGDYVNGLAALWPESSYYTAPDGRHTHGFSSAAAGDREQVKSWRRIIAHRQGR